MAERFEIHECTNDQCGLRFPLDPRVYAGLYCPRCGSYTKVVGHVNEQNSPKSTNNKPIVVVSGLLDNLRSELNVGAAFRTANGAGLSHLYLCGITPTPTSNNRITKTALGAEDSVPWSYHPNALTLADQLKTSGAQLIALESTHEALSLFDYSISPSEHQPVVLIVGGELAGVDPDLLKLCEKVLFIPMRGSKGSLNASVAFGIAAYWLISRV
jgi:23S rRNA (guanosine2251-2'-O)-methyltransferase